MSYLSLSFLKTEFTDFTITYFCLLFPHLAVHCQEAWPLNNTGS